MRTLVIAEHDNATLHSATLHAVTAARKIGGDVQVLVAGFQAGAVADAASRIEGVDGVVVVDAKELQQATAENLAAAALALLKKGGFTHVVATATSSAKNALPRIAARLDVAQASDVIAIESPDTVVRPIYAGSALATMQMLDAVKVMSVRSTAFDAAPAHGGQAPIEPLEGVVFGGRSSVTRRDVAKLDRPELAGARVVISGGRGMGSEASFRLIENVAHPLGAAIGASRGAVDAGYALSDQQVGQTGKVVAPDLYIAVGISGAIQHLAGMKDSKVIVAINRDTEAPIFEVADYGLVGDLFEQLPKLAQELQ